jgi:hypothetical protein
MILLECHESPAVPDLSYYIIGDLSVKWGPLARKLRKKLQALKAGAIRRVTVQRLTQLVFIVVGIE